MNKFFIATLSLTVLLSAGCKKKTDDAGIPDTEQEQVLTDFAGVLANPNYKDINDKANALNAAVKALNTNTNDANLTAARDAWKAVRQPWEQCEGYLFGPVEEVDYDPNTDTWPVNKTSMDTLLHSGHGLALSDIEALDPSLKGYHPLEYMLFGVGGTKTAAAFTSREKLYMISLAQNLYNVTTDLKNSWDASSGNYTLQLVTAGKGSTKFTTHRAAFEAIVTAMGGICEEVGTGKMQEPLEQQDSTIEESRFSHNSSTDFKNNIIGIQNAYFCKYNGATGHSIHDLVASRNLSLDDSIQKQITSAINSFNNFSSNYGQAIYTEQGQIHSTQAAIATLQATLQGSLMTFMQTNIKD